MLFGRLDMVIFSFALKEVTRLLQTRREKLILRWMINTFMSFETVESFIVQLMIARASNLMLALSFDWA